ncbi:efflux RND transporter periplasmic adaptor subunit [Piscinibacter sp. XHJ-5]|uniref:efflux RND transporter periplasmic adaptor subunit n=1 Tax=Piscinibacter sp. XHJ-5 TaxID=3037797 RepID=UPI002452F550|nr:efflux RND transporter periplasmic adaptor subunit [Piscinibacter sp. XHJ-5]
MKAWRALTIVLACALIGALAQIAMAAPPADRDDRIRAQLGSRHSVTISSEIAARIAALPLRDGDAFRAGQLLVGFDCSLYQSQLGKADAGVDAARALAQSNQRLAELHSVGRLEVDQAAARLKEAQADASTARAMASRCSIAAPFAGRVAKRHAAEHQYVTPGSPLLDILDGGPLEVRMIVPSKWLAWLKPGAAFEVDVEELGRRFPAKVQRVGAQIEPVSQTVSVVGVMTQDPALMSGMSGWAVVPRPH